MNNTLIIRTMDDAERAARAMSASGFFQDSKSVAQAVVKILAGAELGFGPFASMTGVHIIENKPTLSANLIAAAVKRSGKYNYRVVKLDNDECILDFYEDGKVVGQSIFTMQHAKTAGLVGKSNWTKYPRNMLFARAISNGQKLYAPDAFNGATVYTPDELGATEDGEGNIIQAQPKEAGPEWLPEIVEAANPDPIPDALWDRFLALCHRAEKVDVNYTMPDRAATTAAELTTYGLEILGFVSQAEAQAKAATEPQE